MSRMAQPDIRTLLLACPFILMTACNSGSRDAVDASFIHIPGESESGDAPRMFWAADSVDLGILAAGETVDIPYQLTNLGKAPLVVTQIKPSCGCTVARDWDRSPLAPAASRTIVLSFDAGDRVGPIAEYATVVSNAVPSSAKLQFSARVMGPEAGSNP